MVSAETQPTVVITSQSPGENFLLAATRDVEDTFKTTEPQVIFVLGASIVKRDTRHRPGGFYDRDSKGNLAWGNVRAIAAAELHQRFPKAQLVTLSRTVYESPAISDAHVVSQEIRHILGQDVTILEYDQSRDTLSELLETLNASLEHGWSRLFYVTTFFQKPRVQAMLDSLQAITDPKEEKKVRQMLVFNERRYSDKPGFASHFRQLYDALLNSSPKAEELDINLIPAEAVLPLRSKHYLPIVSSLIRNKDYLDQIEKDQRATEQWQQGIYGQLSQ